MDEFWVCQHCRSLNRSGTGRCYHCKQNFGTRPKEVPGTIVKGAGGAAPLPLPSNPAFGAAPTAPYLSRPVSFAPAVAVNPLGGTLKAKRGLGRPHPIAAIKRRISWSLSMRPSISIGWLGYLSSVLLVLLLLSGLLLILELTPAAAAVLQGGTGADLSTQLDSGRVGTITTLAQAFGVIGILALVCFSLFTGLATHNAPGLGTPMPVLSPYRAGLSWLHIIWAQLQLAVGLFAPALLIWLGYTIPGLIVALVAVEVAQRHLNDPAGWLTNPYRHTVDLYNKLGVQGATSSSLTTIWSIFFRLANGLAVVIYAAPMLILLFVVGTTLANRPELAVWQAAGLGPMQMVLLVLVAGLLVSTVVSLALMVPITLEIVTRQRTRRTLVRVGRSRSWVARPGGPDAPAAAQPSTRYDANDRTMDRVIERYPDRTPGLDPDQASLYSPSTTSSPWSPDAPDGLSD